MNDLLRSRIAIGPPCLLGRDFPALRRAAPPCRQILSAERFRCRHSSELSSSARETAFSQPSQTDSAPRCLRAGSEAVRCYTCSSDQDPRCADPMDKTMLPTDCSVEQVKRAHRALAQVLGASHTMGVDAFGERFMQYGGGTPGTMGCQKLDLLVTNPLSRQQNYTIRGCVLLPEEPEEHCRRVNQAMQSPQVQNTFCGACRAEGCNAASGLSVATLAALAPVLLTLALARQ
ncbi:Putative alpha,alpha-trehalose-phosphate synthase [UDP-forming] 106 kDa subunit [Frankliniella fusca]|uniref:Alpha,alpha-trehalose-phosphate synthase [UDP-forming] 106 kDa subunit n=1 Tax=Frankliniella fusca TaxID=407009 RepID=A0AAE1GWL2_9NEOP|nr:Putative alpha,alpha-trehalose-phosphate synthase [UDP-forming] 106 kDa subunit [Frankliniella fusca]